MSPSSSRGARTVEALRRFTEELSELPTLPPSTARSSGESQSARLPKPSMANSPPLCSKSKPPAADSTPPGNCQKSSAESGPASE